ncbi:MAG: DUF58 domain-containing protein [Bacteroidales bacterium]
MVDTTKEILKKVKKIEIKTKGLSQHIFAGQYHSAFKGSGMAFSEVREYQYGDDTRNIDWNVTAKYNKPYIKIFEEERELTVMLLVDVSGSNEFGTKNALKEDIITEISAILAFSAILNNDKVGVIFFSDEVEEFIPPKKGTTHILRIIRELVDYKPKSQKTNVSKALEFLSNSMKKRTTAFILSDFLTEEDFETSLRIAKYRHDLVALRIVDKGEENIQNLGLIRIYDKENNNYFWLDSSIAKNRDEVNNIFKENARKLDRIFTRNGIDYSSINTNDDYVKKLKMLFKKRESRM